MNILNPELSYRKGSSSSDITVSCRVQWNDDEMNLRGRYMCKAVLYDDDGASGPSSVDDPFHTHHFAHVECDGRNREITVSETFNLSNDTLNVDGRRHGRYSNQDEIYAKIYITANASTATTNRIRTQF